MLADEAKKIAAKNAWQRLGALIFSGTGILGVILGFMATLSGAYLAGYNDIPRVVMAEPLAAEYRKTLEEARADIGQAVKIIGFDKLSRESQEKLYTALQKIEIVEKALVPSEDDEPVIVFPKLGSLLVTPAYAQEDKTRAIAKEGFRQTLAMGLLIVISVFWLFCLGMYFFSRDEKKISFSANMIQTVLGFYIGVFTGLMGLPSAA